ncbi:16S rRNA (cytosine(967)-C(5))-methyltransferase RsmB [uncultured Flavonifractor sp.]|uniref:16S rRNA (cytosine(967)-C(5))-methyltransferase n=1 Tax=Candidatus Flavonifractor intestinigallinarum TaxID=2838586 RepID=A0A9D2MPK1_9FIRM|nr:16S rRNA (cytosine(967)-C(5))-methyltransferase RsmB [uncultured Flavonifractor sp.]HJB81329.1 16S rRNA (cytosine(967)-C(5))-methyltransferase RsmB [Candidatus Flavonifractor intestinigallinarum]
MTAREAALRALVACEQQGAWSDGFLKKILRTAGLDSRDAALTTRLCFGVLQNRLLLDHYLGKLSTVKLEKMEPAVRNALRLGAYQVLFLDRVPDHAAVSEAVDLARKGSKNPRSAGLVNGVLRSLVRQKDSLEPPEDPAVRYSHPRWLADLFTRRLGREEAAALMAADNGEPPTCAQVNTTKATVEAVADSLRAEGVEVAPHPWLPNCLLLSHTGSLEELTAFREGLFYIQDAAAKLAVLAADPREGMDVLDACAAPGGKSFAAAIAMDGRGKVVSCDIHPHKMDLIRAGAKRLGLDCITAQVLDGKECKEEYLDGFDLVLADVPCSGLGIIRKKPDIRYKDPKPLEGLPRVQKAILDNVCRYVKPGGVLLYATCTLLERENEDVVRAFLDKHKDFTLEGFQVPGDFEGARDGMVTCWPHRHGTDGFFFAKLRRMRGVYEVRPNEGMGPFTLGMTQAEAEDALNKLNEEEHQAVEVWHRFGGYGSPQTFQLEYEDGKLSRIGLDRCDDLKVLYRGLDLTDTHAEDLIPALAKETGYVCDCEDHELACTYEFPALGLELWRESAYHPKLLTYPEFQELIQALPENLEYEQDHGWCFAQVWVQTGSFRAQCPLEPGPAPYAHPVKPTPPEREPTAEEMIAFLHRKYGLTPPERPGRGE